MFALTLLASLPVLAQPPDRNANPEHFFPLFADGDGIRTVLFVKSVSDARNQCNLNLTGQGLDSDRLETHDAVSPAGDGATIELKKVPSLILTSRGIQPLSFGYAILECAEPVVARMLLIYQDGGTTAAMTALESAQTSASSQFPLIPRLGSLGIVLSNTTNQDAACSFELYNPAGASTSEARRLDVSSQSTVFEIVHNVLPIPDQFDSGTATISCNREIGTLGFLLNENTFTALPAISLNADSDALSHQELPLIVDGAGFQSHLLVTNLSRTRNECQMNLAGEGLNYGRFSRTDASLILPREGDHLTISSAGGSSLAFGSALFDCDGPVVAQNLLTSKVQQDLVGMALISDAQYTNEFEFPYLPWISRLALVVNNNSDLRNRCEFRMRDNYGVSRMVLVTTIPARTRQIRFFSDLFFNPENVAKGVMEVSCAQNITSLALPLDGAVFAAMPPTVLSFAPILGPVPVFAEEDHPGDLSFLRDQNIVLELPRAYGGDGNLTYSLSPQVPGLDFYENALFLGGKTITEGEYDMTLKATDENGNFDLIEFTITVVDGTTALNTPVSFSEDVSLDNLTFELGGPIDVVELPPVESGYLRIYYNLSPLVPGMEFDNTSRQLSGTPSLPGVYGVSYWALNRWHTTDSLDFTITVVAPVSEEFLIEIDGCADGRFIDDPNSNPALVEDCRALVEFANTPIRQGLTDKDHVLRQWGRGDQTKLTAWDGIGISHGRITAIELAGRDLTGAIPPVLGLLDELVMLDLSGPSFTMSRTRTRPELTGTIPTELGNLTKLQHLFLRGNHLSGDIPPDIGNLKALRELWLGGNELTGVIPSEIGELTNLQVLSIRANRLGGAFPAFLASLTSLRTISAADNQFYGSIPSEISRLSALGNLNLERNQFSGAIPPQFANLHSLHSLVLNNNDLTGEIPPELGRLNRLRRLSLNGNQLTGSIPSSFGALQNLSYLGLADNKLSGAIPTELANAGRLFELNLSQNKLSGSVPWGFQDRVASGELFLRVSVNQIPGFEPPPIRARNPEYSANPSTNGNAELQSVSYFQGPLVLQMEIDANAMPVEYQTPILGRWAVLAVSVKHNVAEPPLVISRVLNETGNVVIERLAEAAHPATESAEAGGFLTEFYFDMPGEYFQAGYQVVHVIDPENELAETDETDNISQPFVIYGEKPPVFRVTIVPMHFPDEEPPSIDSETIMAGTSALLPIADDYDVQIHAPLELTSPSSEWLTEIANLWNAEAEQGEFYHGITNAWGGGLAGGKIALSGYSIHEVIPHEFGHNLSLDHPPDCGSAPIFVDRDYPYPSGQLGPDRGWHLNWRHIVTKDSKWYGDVMCYTPTLGFISDYNYRKASEYWLSVESETSTDMVLTAAVSSGEAPTGETQTVSTYAGTGSLALSGQIGVEGAWSLGQAQLSERGPRPPAEDGEYLLRLFDSAGVQVYEEPLAIILLTEGEESFWAARTPLPLRTAREIVILDDQGNEVLRQFLPDLE